MKRAMMLVIAAAMSFAVATQTALFAGPVTPARAVRAAAAWVAMGPAAGKTPTGEVDTFALDGTDAFHLVALAGGGFAALPADDNAPPVLGFAASGALPGGDDGSPLWDIIAASAGVGDDGGDLDEDGGTTARFTVRKSTVGSVKPSAARASASRRATAAPRATAASAPAAGITWEMLDAAGISVDDAEDDSHYTTHIDNQTESDLLDDVRVDPFVETHWGQTLRDVYSLYVPHPDYPCGCVALAMAQVMRYHRWPQGDVPKFKVWCTTDRNTIPPETNELESVGGSYDWDAMVTDPTSDSPLEQRLAISKICYDCGVSMRMKYGAGASGCSTPMSFAPFTNYFGYASAHSMYLLDLPQGENIARLLRSTLLASLDAKLPTVLSVRGHAIVGDGYGFSKGDLYVHVNFGAGTWRNWDWWILAPSYGEFGTIRAVVYNIMPTDGGELLTGRVTDSTGAPVAGATVTARITCGGAATTATATTSGRGVYAIRTPSADCSIELTAAQGEKTSAVRNARTSASFTGSKYSQKMVSTSFNPGVRKCGNSWGNDLEILGAAETPYSEEPKSWVDERAATTGRTGSWQKSVSYDGDGIAAIENGNEFAANTASSRDPVAVTVKMRFDGGIDPAEMPAETQASVRLGPDGGFQLYTVSGGEKKWVDVVAAGVTPDEATVYTIKTRFDYAGGTYSMSVWDGTAFKPLKAGSQTEFPLASAASSLSCMRFVGSGAVESILGGNANFAAGDREGLAKAAALTAAQAAWLNGLGDYDTVRGRVATLTAERLARAYLLNLDVMRSDYGESSDYLGFTFTVAGMSVDADNVYVDLKLVRNSPMKKNDVAQPINGSLLMYGTGSLGGDWAEVSAATGLEFDADGNATVTIPKTAAAKFFRPVIE